MSPRLSGFCRLLHHEFGEVELLYDVASEGLIYGFKDVVANDVFDAWFLEILNCKI